MASYTIERSGHEMAGNEIYAVWDDSRIGEELVAHYRNDDPTMPVRIFRSYGAALEAARDGDLSQHTDMPGLSDWNRGGHWEDCAKVENGRITWAADERFGSVEAEAS